MNQNIFQNPIKEARTEHFGLNGFKWDFITLLMLIWMTNVKLTEAKTSNIKYILQWTPNDTHPFNTWYSGQTVFHKLECPVSNCFVTNQRDYFGGDLTKFDAIVFNGRNLKKSKLSDLPKKRSPHQKYVFLNMESSDNQPICKKIFDGFFNWTATYKLKSDIVYSYFLIKNASGVEVGPGVNMTWINQMTETDEALVHSLKTKTKAAAWFVSHCSARNGRGEYAERLKTALLNYNLTLDIYGKCGDLSCPRSEQKKCENMLRDQYFFYLSFENSFAEDYITEKAVTPLVSTVVPVVYSGVNYSRFLPPGSYIDARSHEPEQLAALMAGIIKAPAESGYYDFFRWRNHYTFGYPKNVCKLCAALHNPTMFDVPSVYEDFRGWWNPDHKSRCKNRKWGS